jgi:hypothetical protein
MVTADRDVSGSDLVGGCGIHIRSPFAETQMVLGLSRP